MIIKDISIRHKNDFDGRTFSFHDKKNLFVSHKNAQGKTTFLRSILYSLGFPIPSMKQIDFSKYEFSMTVECNDMLKHIKRFNKTIIIDETIYTLPDDTNKAIANIFSLDNDELTANILGAVYIDQEKGWTLLNRGKIIGENSFNIESFLRGLNNNDVSDLKKQLSEVKNEIRKYNLIRDVAEYKNEISKIENPILISDYNENVNNELAVVENKIERLNNRIKETQAAKNSNTKFANYINSIGLRVMIQGEEYVITKDDLVGFKEFSNLATIQINELAYEKNQLIKKKKELLASLKSDSLVDSATVLQGFDSTISSFNTSAIKVSNILEDLEKEKNELNEKIKHETMFDNRYVQKISLNIEKYWKELKIEIPYSENYLFTHDLKSLSGAILYKMIIAYKFSYILAIQEKCGYKVPVFIDSPSGREVTKKTVENVLKILFRDFSDNQVFLCSIFKFENVLHLQSENILYFDKNKPFDRTMTLV